MNYQNSLIADESILMRLLALLCILFAFVVPARAQETVDIQLLVNDFSLTLYIEAEGVVSLADVGLRVGTDELYPLSRYAELLDLDLSQVRTPICIRLERYLPYGAEKPPMTLDCIGVRTPRAVLDPANVFWFDDGGMNTTRLMYLTLASVDINPPCPAGSARCLLSLPLMLRPLSDVPIVTPAAAGEILFVLTKFRQVSGTAREPEILLTQTLDEAMEAARERGVNVRIALVNEEIDTREQARRLADETGATVVIWGQVDPAGLDTRYEIVEREGEQIETQVNETSFTALASLDEVDLRIRNAPEQRYVANFTIGQILYFDDQYDEAIPFFDEALALTTDAPAAMQVALDVGASYFYLGRSLLDTTADPTPMPRLHRAIGTLETALTFYTDESYGWAAAQNNLGIAYSTLAAHAEPEANLRRAIAAYEEALRFRTEQTAPLNFAATQNNLGVAYRDLAAHVEPEANLRRAIAAYEEALRFRTEQTAPLDFATTQNNLGAAYRDLAAHAEPEANLRRAIAAYEEALRFLTEQTAPLNFAATIGNLGIALYLSSEVGEACALWREATDIYREFGVTARVEAFEGVIEQLCQPTPIPLPTATPMPRAQAVLGEQSGTLKIGGGDVWTFDGQAGDVLNIRVNAFSPANDAENRDGLLDTLLRVYTPDGTLLAEADDIEAGVITDSELLDLELPVSGTYRIEVRSWNDETGGGYTLTIERVGS